MLLVARALAGIAVVKLAWTLAAVAFGSLAVDAPAGGLAFGVLPTTFLSLVYGTAGAFLLWAAPGLSRGSWLGGTLLMIAAAFGDAVLSRRVLTGWEPGLAAALPIDAFLPFFWWSFLRLFPRVEHDRPDVVADWCVVVAGIVGGATCGASFVSHLWPGALPFLVSPLTVPRTGAWYVGAVIGLTGAGLPYLWWKSRFAQASESQRVRLFAAGLLVGCGPLMLDIMLSALSPAYDRWAWRPEVAALRIPALFVMLALVPLATAYSVLVDQVVDLRVALRAAAQYALARYTLLAVVSVPFALLAAYLYSHRSEPLADLLGGPRVVLAAALIALGIAAMRQRRRWLLALDRRFFRDEADSAALVTTLANHAQSAATDVDLSRFVRTDVAAALHVEHATLLVADPARTALVDPEGRVPPLGYSSSLVMLLVGDSAPFEVAAHPVVARLPAQERKWLLRGAFDVLVPLRRSPTSLMAMLALGPKRSGQPFTPGDHRVLAAVAGAVGLALENHRLKSSPSGDDEEPAEECLTCGTLLPPGTEVCPCGGELAHAVVPYVLRGSFQFEARLGAGGMGVVFRASDLRLRRPVAIKTLPRVSLGRAERLRDEARTMARLAHPNLATIHGVETWRTTPLLVVELLAGGTLAHRLKSGPLPLADVIAMGISLGDVLEHIHGADMVHCDIKPSNIGFTGGGTLKLLDFGLAQILADGDTTVDAILIHASQTGSTHVGDLDASRPASGRFAGTPLYMAPEALAAQRPSPAFDLWSTAVVLYEALAGHHPFAGGTSDEIVARIRSGKCVGADALRTRWPPACIDGLERCLSPDRQRRPASAAELRGLMYDLRLQAQKS